jgi:septal ring factor EnvC (AmiA/AmiB activator)
MIDVLVDLIRHDPAAAVNVILALIGVIAAYAVYLIIRRGNKDAEIVGRTLAKEQDRLDREQQRNDALEEDITEQSRERWRLIAERAQVEEQLRKCQEKLQERGIGSMTLFEENALRDMIVAQQTTIHEKNERIKHLTIIIRNAGYDPDTGEPDILNRGGFGL